MIRIKHRFVLFTFCIYIFNIDVKGGLFALDLTFFVDKRFGRVFRGDDFLFNVLSCWNVSAGSRRIL